MIIIRPVNTTDATLVSTNVAETDDTEWSNVTAYVVGDTCMVTDSGIHKLYECLVNNTDKYPPDNSNKTIPTPAAPYWLYTAPTNRWAMFNDSITTQTENSTSIDVDITPGELVNGVALFNLDAETVQIVMDDPTAGEVYNTTTNLQTAVIDSWYSFFFEERTYKQDFVALDLPAYPSATITVTINKTGTAKCGFLSLGKQRSFGDANYGTSVGIVDYSIKSTDEFGVQTIVTRAFSKRVNFDVTIDTPFVSEVQRTLALYRTTPMAWVGSEDFEATIVFGYYRDFDIVFSNPALSKCSIIVEGMT